MSARGSFSHITSCLLSSGILSMLHTSHPHRGVFWGVWEGWALREPAAAGHKLTGKNNASEEEGGSSSVSCPSCPPLHLFVSELLQTRGCGRVAQGAGQWH